MLIVDLIVTAIVAGVIGTLAMDLLNSLFSRAGMITKIDIGMIGRMSAGWAHGHFRYRHPGEMEPVLHEKFLGYVTHHAIGVGLSFIYVFGWALFVGGPPSPAWALAYGIATTVAPLFLVYPSMGMGVCGIRSPEGIKNTISSLANHLFFGVGMAIAVVLT